MTRDVHLHPLPLSGLQAESISDQPTSVRLTWAAPESNVAPDGYLVSWLGEEVKVLGTSIWIHDLPPTTDVAFTVRSLAGCLTSTPVTVSYRTPLNPEPRPPLPPENPTNVTLSTVASTSARLTWQAPAFANPGPTNVNGTPDSDGRPETLRQTAPGQWPARTVARSGKPLPIEKRAGFITNAGQAAQLAVAAKSPSVKKVIITFDAKTKTYRMTAAVKPGKSTGSVTVRG